MINTFISISNPVTCNLFRVAHSLKPTTCLFAALRSLACGTYQYQLRLTSILLHLHREGGTQHVRIRGDQFKKFSGNPEISLQLHSNPKISAHFILRNLYMNIKCTKTMQIKVMIAPSEPRNISQTMFGVKKYHEDSFSFIWTQKYHIWQYSDQKISDLLPRMCIC